MISLEEWNRLSGHDFNCRKYFPIQKLAVRFCSLTDMTLTVDSNFGAESLNFGDWRRASSYSAFSVEFEISSRKVKDFNF
jgi:hypothetical protein